MNRTFLTLLRDHDGEKLKNWFASQKVDGIRAFWDGGVTRGHPCTDIQFCNPSNGGKLSTGLWSRYGKIIHAPPYFLDSLPAGVPLDGELFYHSLQRTKSVVRRHVPDNRWKSVRFYAFDIPPGLTILGDGRINTPYWEDHHIKIQDNWKWVNQMEHRVNKPFRQRARLIPEYESEYVIALDQQLVESTEHGLELTHQALTGTLPNLIERVKDCGFGEGIVFKHPTAKYEVWRSRNVLRIKEVHEAIAVVLSVSVDPRSIYVEWNNTKFNIGSGLKVLPEAGQTITFKYASLTSSGIPREARMT